MQVPGSNAAQQMGLQGFPGALPVSAAASLYPEFALFSQFAHLFPQPAAQLAAAAVASQRSDSTSQDTGAQVVRPTPQYQVQDQGGKRTKAHASRHLAAEQRRRMRINDRLERLRQLVPHAERANTATILENAYSYIELLQRRIKDLEAGTGTKVQSQQTAKNMPHAATEPFVASAPSAAAGTSALGPSLDDANALSKLMQLRQLAAASSSEGAPASLAAAQAWPSVSASATSQHISASGFRPFARGINQPATPPDASPLAGKGSASEHEEDGGSLSKRRRVSAE